MYRHFNAPPVIFVHGAWLQGVESTVVSSRRETLNLNATLAALAAHPLWAEGDRIPVDWLWV